MTNNQKPIVIAIIIAGILIALGLVFNSYFSSKSETAKPTPTSQLKEIIINENDHIQGSADAPVTIVEWSDFQCSYCSAFHETMNRVKADYGDQVRWVFKHFPLTQIHPFAFKAAEASECADEQSKFWEYSDQLYQRQKDLSSSIFEEIAKDLNLDQDQFKTCLSSEKYKSKVNASYQEGVKIGVRGTPGNFINGVELGGAVSYEQLRELIEAELK